MLLTQNEFESYDVSKFKSYMLKEFIHKFISTHPEVRHLNLTKWNVSNVVDMHRLFRGYDELVSIDITGWNTHNVESMSCMFLHCKSLKEIKGLNNLDTSNVQRNINMFRNCRQLNGFDLLPNMLC